MTPTQFKTLRNSRGYTRDELGVILGISASAIVQWERGTRSIPAWAAEKMIRTVSISLPLEDLALLLQECTTQGNDFSAYLTEIIRAHLRAAQTEQSLRVAEDPPDEYKPHA